MNVQAEISLYPLRTNDLGHVIEMFLGKLSDAGLSVQQGNMSSMVSGEVDDVFAAVGIAFKNVANDKDVVLLMKVSNACPSDDTVEGMNADVE